MEDKIKLIDDKTNMILSRPPGWVYRWGVAVTITSVCLLLFLSFVIPYKESITCKVKFRTTQQILPVLSPVDGFVGEHPFYKNKAIKANQFLFTIYDVSNKEYIDLKAPHSGLFMPAEYNLRGKTYVKKNDTLFYIVPQIKDNRDLYAAASVNAFELSKLNPGNKVQLSISQFGKVIDLFGSVSFISRIPDQKGNYPFFILLENKDIRYLSAGKLIYFNQTGTAEVTYRTEKIFYKLFNFL
ncbi:HlyD family secretion protein [Pedobacter westerhofensis]|uniref:HlyD family secretion protein n=1 Tax=Pedobacter westerhofensis TaxID=425512 RepID=A0A521D258_9SPHI|nr:HlyD family secretion protein [Pedobacter westerhofensis]SMO64980.1 HlyD family secretion protein [Pedobacter westerhofensis]